MTNIDSFAGLPVKTFDPKARKSRAKCAWRLRLEHDDAFTFPELVEKFLDKHGGPDLTVLVIGAWNYTAMCERGSSEVVQPLVKHRDRMPNLKHLFFGDIRRSECEISWITHGNISALLPAFPQLEEFRIRGTNGYPETLRLSFGRLAHPSLKTFAIESGGLPETLLAEVWAADLPKLEFLELWLGSPNYGGIDDMAPLEPLLADRIFPHLKHLGLCNSEVADELARVVAAAPILSRLEELDLSLGNMSDDGARALLASPAIRTLSLLNLSHHFISKPVQAELKKLGVPVDLSDPCEPDVWDGEEHRYNTVSE